jgi:hypothetical protein
MPSQRGMLDLVWIGNANVVSPLIPIRRRHTMDPSDLRSIERGITIFAVVWGLVIAFAFAAGSERSSV